MKFAHQSATIRQHGKGMIILETALETAGLTYVFPDGNGIKNIAFQVKRGEIYALYGGHHAGKSVLLQTIIGTLRPQAGTLKLFGNIDYQKERRRIGFVPQKPVTIGSLSPADMLRYFSSVFGTTEIHILDILHLNLKEKKAVRRLPLSTQRLVNLAVALLGNPDMIILDDPFSGLDKGECEHLLSVLNYSLIFPLTLFLCLYFTEDFHTGTYSITLSKGTSRVHLFFGKLLASWGGVLFFLFVCFGVSYLSILMMGASRYDIKYSFSAIGVFLLFQCLCFLGYTAFLNLLSYLLRHRIIVTITAFFMLGVLYLYLTKISTALDMDYSLYKYWVVGLSHSLQINTFGEDLIPICLTLVVYLFLPTAISLSLFLRLDLRNLERR